MQRQEMLWLAFLSFSLRFLLIVGSTEVNTQDICRRDPPSTTASKTPGDNGFRIKIAGRPQPEKYTPGQVYTITINGTYEKQNLLGFMLVAVPAFATDETTSLGTFQHFNHGLTKFADRCPHIVTHSYEHPKPGVEVLWTAPPEGTGCVEFRATVLEYKDIWYKNDGALTKVFCENDTMLGETRPDDIAECCACGTAKYQMVFEGLWSRQTHPMDYPSATRMLHWSNIVGASHSKSYFLWQYGGYSSRGVKEVCEFGYTRTMEQEMRMHSHDVRTVIKTPGIWWKEPHGLLDSRWGRFSVDRKNHLLSMLTMLGPSPDWCVGVSALDLCQANCSWAAEMSIDLYPWDAGTDDGITYMAANRPSEPQERIHRLTNTYPSNPESPFYGDEPLKPFAKIHLRRIYPKEINNPKSCNGNDDLNSTLEFSEGFDSEGLEGDMEKKKMMMLQGGKCAMTDWGDWSDCSVTCGVGQRFRKRMYLNNMVDEDMCGFSTMESENCIGMENFCAAEVQESVDEPCSVTKWSDWSPCSATCGKGLKERRRYYLKKMDMDKCNRKTEEREMCVAEVMDCHLATNTKNFTAICALEKDVGPCRGSFTRWYYDRVMGKCLPFTYGGCRGNNNRFRSEEECVDMCMDIMKQVDGPPVGESTDNEHKPDPHEQAQKDKGEAVDCMMTPWSEWSECSATCGRDSFKFQRRMVKRDPENGGKKCPKKVEKKKRCKRPKCPKSEEKDKQRQKQKSVDCVLGPWGEWSRCAKTCGDDSIQERTRPVLHFPRRDGKPCDPRLDRRICALPPCALERRRERQPIETDRIRQLFNDGV